MAKKEKTVKELRHEKREIEEQERQKAIRQAEKEKRRELNASGGGDAEIPAEVRAYNKKKMLLISLIAGGLALILLATSITLFIVYANPYRDSKYPVAVLHMSDGNKLAFQLYDDSAPVAVAVFHYYAYHGYYNGTVIDTLYNPDPQGDENNSRGYMKLGGYTTGKSLNGEETKIRMFEKDGKYNQAIYKFYMNDDKTATGKTNVLGALSTINVSSLGASAEFQINVSDDGVQGDSLSGRCFGMAYEETKKTLLKYKETLRTTTTAKTDNKGYVLDSSLVYIKKIKFYNADNYKGVTEYNEDFKSNYVKNVNRSY